MGIGIKPARIRKFYERNNAALWNLVFLIGCVLLVIGAWEIAPWLGKLTAGVECLAVAYLAYDRGPQ